MSKNHALAVCAPSALPDHDTAPSAPAEPGWQGVSRRASTDPAARAQLAALVRRASLGTMTSAMVHDVASIVQGMQCALDEIQFLLADQVESSPELREAFGNGAEMSARMLRLFHAISHFLRSRSISDFPCSVELLVDRARLICDAYTRPRATLRIGALPDAAVAVGEAAVLQVLVNFIRNAAEASPPGGFIDLEVFDEGDAVRFVVTDDGPGVPAEVAGEIFEVGMGLAISASVIAEHGGTLGYRRAPGRGAELTLVVPAHRSET